MRSRKRENFEKYGDTFFVTFSVVGHTPIFEQAQCRDIIIDNLGFYQERGDFTIIAYVVMPNHIHIVVNVKKNLSVSLCIGNFKRITSRQISKHLHDTGNHALIKRLLIAAEQEPAKDTKIWKPRFDSFVLNNIDTLNQKIQYIHNNPVKAGLVENPNDWPYSSASSYSGCTGCHLEVDTQWRSLGFD